MFNELQLDERILNAIEKCGYTTPTPIQAKAIPAILKGSDVVASAQTGTGKTAAFVLPALQFLSTQAPSKATRVLILTPTRELAAQITKAADLYGKFMKFNIVSLVGGMPYHNQIRDLQRGADIIVATPGRLMDHMEAKRVDLSQVNMLILDEADRMLDMGFIDDVQYIAKLTPQKRQTLLFSATVDKQLTNIVRHLLTDPVRIDMSAEKLSAPKITQELYRATSPQHKNRMLKHFLSGENIYKAIIFSATKINADRLAQQLRDDGFSAAALHGDLRQNVRNRTIEDLRRGKIQFLVATDVAARGIDISDITHVINYDLPKFSEDYVHRIGRTGRAGKEGTAISFVMPTDTRNVQKIERYLGQRIPMIHHFDIDKVAPRAGGETTDHSSSREDYSDERPARKSFRNDGDRPARSANEAGFRSRTEGRSSSSAGEGYRGRSEGGRSSSSAGEGYRGRSEGGRSSSSAGEGYRGRSEGGRSSSSASEGYRGRSEGGRSSSSAGE
ncbi:MAG: DEAD/DEAH box helicase, partial [Gammaproteobacteria bacterium]